MLEFLLSELESYLGWLIGENQLAEVLFEVKKLFVKLGGGVHRTSNSIREHAHHAALIILFSGVILGPKHQMDCAGQFVILQACKRLLALNIDDDIESVSLFCLHRMK